MSLELYLSGINSQPSLSRFFICLPHCIAPPPIYTADLQSSISKSKSTMAMCAPPPSPLCAVDSDRFYKFGTPSPPSVPKYSLSCYSELEESSFSDEEIQNVRQYHFTVVAPFLFERGSEYFLLTLRAISHTVLAL